MSGTGRRGSRSWECNATRNLGVRYPVVQDNGFAIWKGWGGRYWPTTWLVDRRGVVRYRHIGEGAYDETETMIQALLKEGKGEK